MYTGNYLIFSFFWHAMKSSSGALRLGCRSQEGVFFVRAGQKSPCRTSRQGKRRMSFLKNYRLIVSSSSNMESAVVMIFDAAE